MALSKSQINDRLKKLRKIARENPKKFPAFKWVKVKSKEELKVMHNCVLDRYGENQNYYIAYINEVPFLMNKLKKSTRRYVDAPYLEELGAPYNLNIGSYLELQLLKQFLKQYNVSIDLNREFSKLKLEINKLEVIKKSLEGKHILLHSKSLRKSQRVLLVSKEIKLSLCYLYGEFINIKFNKGGQEIVTLNIRTRNPQKELNRYILTKEQAIKTVKLIRTAIKREATKKKKYYENLMKKNEVKMKQKIKDIGIEAGLEEE